MEEDRQGRLPAPKPCQIQLCVPSTSHFLIPMDIKSGRTLVMLFIVTS